MARLDSPRVYKGFGTMIVIIRTGEGSVPFSINDVPVDLPIGQRETIDILLAWAHTDHEVTLSLIHI